MKSSPLSTWNFPLFTTVISGITGIILSFSSSPAEAGIIYSGVAAGDVTTNSTVLWTKTADTIPSLGIVSKYKLPSGTMAIHCTHMASVS